MGDRTPQDLADLIARARREGQCVRCTCEDPDAIPRLWRITAWPRRDSGGSVSAIGYASAPPPGNWRKLPSDGHALVLGLDKADRPL